MIIQYYYCFIKEFKSFVENNIVPYLIFFEYLYKYLSLDEFPKFKTNKDL
jgi:hypothetical protein